METSVLKVALIQMHPKVLQVETNFEYAAQQIRRAAADGASLAVLPEYHLTGWAPQNPQFAVAAASADQYIGRYQALACECKINIVPGTIVLAINSGSEMPRLVNKAFFISTAGEILGEYTKVNLWHPEREHLTPGHHVSLDGVRTTATAPRAPKVPQAAGDGSHHPVVATPLGLVGLLVCYDLAFPEAARSLVRAGARIIIIPTFTKSDDPSHAARLHNPDCEALFTQSALVSRACENTCAIIFCNVGGPAADGYMGLSQITLPLVGVVPGSFTDSTPGMRIVDLDLSILDVAEENYRIRDDLSKDDFHY